MYKVNDIVLVKSTFVDNKGFNKSFSAIVKITDIFGSNNGTFNHEFLTLLKGDIKDYEYYDNILYMDIENIVKKINVEEHPEYFL